MQPLSMNNGRWANFLYLSSLTNCINSWILVPPPKIQFSLLICWAPSYLKLHSVCCLQFGLSVVRILISVSYLSIQQQPNKYYFVVANAKFMLDEEEHFQELMFERLRNYKERVREQDFWLVIEPKFLDKFPSITKRLRRPAVALVSTNGTWIK